MKIKEMHSQDRRDFTATMMCEHCSHTERNTCGYDDDHYHNNVIPSWHCKSCGKNRAGTSVQEKTA